MARRQRSARSEEDEREWSFSDQEFAELDKRITRYGEAVGKKVVRHLIKDGKPVVPEGESGEGGVSGGDKPA